MTDPGTGVPAAPDRLGQLDATAADRRARPGAPIEEVIGQLTTIQGEHPALRCAKAEAIAGRSGQQPADRSVRVTGKPRRFDREAAAAMAPPTIN